jgi:hypothetical protein
MNSSTPKPRPTTARAAAPVERRSPRNETTGTSPPDLDLR